MEKVIQEHDVASWERAIKHLEERSAVLARQRGHVRGERRLLLRVIARDRGNNKFAEERLQIVRRELEETEQEAKKIHRARITAGRLLVAAQHAQNVQYENEKC